MPFCVFVIFFTYGGLRLAYACANAAVFQMVINFQFDGNYQVLVEYKFQGINECATR